MYIINDTKLLNLTFTNSRVLYSFFYTYFTILLCISVHQQVGGERSYLHVLYSLFYTYFTILLCISVYQQVAGDRSYNTRIILPLLHIFHNPTMYFSVSASGWREIVFTRIILPLLHIFHNPTLYFSVSASGWREIVPVPPVDSLHCFLKNTRDLESNPIKAAENCLCYTFQYECVQSVYSATQVCSKWSTLLVLNITLFILDSVHESDAIANHPDNNNP